MNLPRLDLEPKARHIAQGEWAVGGTPGEMISTILGSCVAVCLHDPLVRIGGMNHFLLPESSGSTVSSASFGINAMELLINALVKEGAVRARLQGKVLGGARMIAGLSTAGTKNGAFILDFLRRERIACLSQSLGGFQARCIIFWPEDGRVKQKLLGKSDFAEPAPIPRKPNEVELFD